MYCMHVCLIQLLQSMKYQLQGTLFFQYTIYVKYLFHVCMCQHQLGNPPLLTPNKQLCLQFLLTYYTFCHQDSFCIMGSEPWQLQVIIHVRPCAQMLEMTGFHKDGSLHVTKIWMYTYIYHGYQIVTYPLELTQNCTQE